MKSTSSCDGCMSTTKILVSSLKNSGNKGGRLEVSVRNGVNGLGNRMSANSFLGNMTKNKPRLSEGNILKDLSLVLTPSNIKNPFKFNEQCKTEKACSKKFELKSPVLNSEILTSRSRWEGLKFPASPTEILSKFSDILPKWEQEEILNYKDIYYIGKNLKPKDPEFDHENGDYRILIKDHIAFRYEIIGLIGKGSFGQVIEVYDHKEKKSIALKIIKNKAKYNQQANTEIEILEAVKTFDQHKISNIIEILESFVFRKHTVAVI